MHAFVSIIIIIIIIIEIDAASDLQGHIIIIIIIIIIIVIIIIIIIVIEIDAARATVTSLYTIYREPKSQHPYIQGTPPLQAQSLHVISTQPPNGEITTVNNKLCLGTVKWLLTLWLIGTLPHHKYLHAVVQ